MFIQDIDQTAPSATLYQQVRVFYASEVIDAGEFVSLDTSKSDVLRATHVALLDLDDTNAFLFVGVALEAANAAHVAAGGTIRVCTAGYVEDAVTTGSIAVRAGLVPSTTEGAVQTIPNQNDGTASIRQIGVALEAASGNTVDAWIYPTGF